jgi:branched-chain amino acid transport system permease protein
MSPALLGAALANGAVLGSLYALFALSIVLLFRTTGVGNFAAGSMAMFLAFVTYRVCLFTFHLPLLVAFAGGIVAGALLGAAIYGVVISVRPGYGPLNLTFRCIGVYSLLTALAVRFWAQGEPYSVHSLAPKGRVSVLGLNISLDQLLVMAIALCACGVMFLVLGRSGLGLRMRAVASNRSAATLVGVDVRAVEAGAWITAGMLAALIGNLFAPITLLSIDMMDAFLISGFTAAVLGGIYSFPGAVVGGLMLGLIASVASVYVDPAVQALITVLLLAGILLWRPQGLFGSTTRIERV